MPGSPTPARWTLWICPNCDSFAEDEPGTVCESCETGTIEAVRLWAKEDVIAAVTDFDAEHGVKGTLGYYRPAQELIDFFLARFNEAETGGGRWSGVTWTARRAASTS